MRLICPSCGAQYDVPDDAIPPAGREVQCSSCNHAWFEIDSPPGPQQAAPVPPEVTPPAIPVSPAAEAELRRPVDDQVKAILREEAARDSALAAKPPAEAQIPAQLPATTQAANPKVAKSAVPPAPVAATDNRPQDMPSMEEINASLRARSQTAGRALTTTEQHEAAERRGFRSGFLLMLLLLAILALPYLYADQIGTALPQAQDWLARYVILVDQLRVAVDQWATALANQINALVANIRA